MRRKEGKRGMMGRCIKNLVNGFIKKMGYSSITSKFIPSYLTNFFLDLILS